MTSTIHALPALGQLGDFTSSVDIAPTPEHAAPAANRIVDAAVVARAARGNEAAQRVIYEQFSDSVFRLAHRMTGNVATAEDLTQDVFLRIFDKLGQFRGESRFGTWLHRLAVTVILNGTRHRGTEQREITLETTVATNTGERPKLEPDTRDRVRHAVAQLPNDLRMVVLMYDVEGYSHDEIAELMGVSSGASRMRLLRARQLLRGMLAQDGEELER